MPCQVYILYNCNNLFFRAPCSHIKTFVNTLGPYLVENSVILISYWWMGHGVEVYLISGLSEVLNVVVVVVCVCVCVCVCVSINKRAVQKFDMERPILKKMSQTKILSMFGALGNLGDNRNISHA